MQCEPSVGCQGGELGRCVIPSAVINFSKHRDYKTSPYKGSLCDMLHEDDRWEGLRSDHECRMEREFDVEIQYTYKLNATSFSTSQKLAQSYTNSGFAEDLLRHYGISGFIEFRH
jgi:hypothetical protein